MIYTLIKNLIKNKVGYAKLRGGERKPYFVSFLIQIRRTRIDVLPGAKISSSKVSLNCTHSHDIATADWTQWG